MSNLNPAIWSRLPLDIIPGIIDCLDTSEIKKWSSVSRGFFSHASARLWRTLRIQACEIATYKRLQKSDSKGDRETHKKNIVHFLIHNVHRQNAGLVFHGLRDLDTPMHMYRPNAEYPEQKSMGLSEMMAKSPGSMVRHLEISDREALTHMDSKFEDVLSQLFICLDGLRYVLYDGKLKPCTFAKITEIRTLTSLSLRVGSEQGSLPASSSLDRGPWKPVRLDFEILATLPHLRTLRIGHLTNGEAEGLATAVMSSKLERLQVSTTGWLVWHGNRPIAAREFRIASPLVAFLYALATVPLVDEHQPRGFPLTLCSLVLSDRYYPRLPSLHRRLINLVTHCEMLDNIELQVLVSGLNTRRNGLDSPNIHSHYITVGVQSWDQLPQTEEVPITYNYWCPTYSGDGSRRFVITRFPKGHPGLIANIARVLDEILAKHLEDKLTSPYRHRQYLRTMRFSKKLHQSCKRFQDGVVEVQWVQASLVNSGQLSVEEYLRHVGFRRGPIQ